MPGETEEMLWDTIKLNRKIKPTWSGCNIFYPYKGTPLGDKCFKENLVDLEKYHDFSNERRQSVLAYDQEWLDKLIYYHSNWIKLISNNNDGFFTKSVKNTIQTSKSIVKQIPLAGPAMVKLNNQFIFNKILSSVKRNIEFNS